MQFPSYLEPLANVLRGRQKSIRARFWTLPKEELVLRFYQLTGRSWIDFYGDRLDRMGREHIGTLPNEKYLDGGRLFLEFLKKQGLERHHRILDYGCGIMRAALHLVPYLDQGRYTGVDISRARIEHGKWLLSNAGIPEDGYAVHAVRDCALRELKDQKFDFVWANSVLTHMPESDIQALLKALKHHLHADSNFYFTYSLTEPDEANGPKRLNTKDFYYPESYIRKIFEDAGYEFVVVPDGVSDEYGSPTVRARLVGVD